MENIHNIPDVFTPAFQVHVTGWPAAAQAPKSGARQAAVIWFFGRIVYLSQVSNLISVVYSCVFRNIYLVMPSNYTEYITIDYSKILLHCGGFLFTEMIDYCQVRQDLSFRVWG